MAEEDDYFGFRFATSLLEMCVNISVECFKLV